MVWSLAFAIFANWAAYMNDTLWTFYSVVMSIIMLLGELLFPKETTK